MHPSRQKRLKAIKEREANLASIKEAPVVPKAAPPKRKTPRKKSSTASK